MNKDDNILKISKYAFFIDRDIGDILIYSSLSGTLIRIYDAKAIEEINRIRNAETIEYTENYIIKTLCDKKILLCEDADEDELVDYLYTKNVLQSRSLELTLVVTRQCNLRCVYCGQAHESRKRMSEATYDGVIKYIRAVIENRNFNSVFISFFGGEPLMEYKNIVVFLEKLKALSEELKFHYSAGMTTNAYLLTKQKFNKLVSLGCNNYQITLDGPENTHDKTRVLRNGSGTWNVIFNNLVYTISTKFDFKITLRTNYNHDILSELDDFYKLIEEKLKDDRIEIYFETIKDHGNDKTPEVMGEVEEIIGNSEASSLVKRHGLKMAKRNIAPCGMMCRVSLPNFYTIDYNADVIKCTHLLDWPDNRIEHLSDDGVMVVKTDLEIKWSYFNIRKNADCSECKLLPLCFGKRCPIDVVAGCFSCNGKLREINLIESLEMMY